MGDWLMPSEQSIDRGMSHEARVLIDLLDRKYDETDE